MSVVEKSEKSYNTAHIVILLDSSANCFPHYQVEYRFRSSLARNVSLV